MIQSITAMEVSQVGQTSCALHPDPHPQILAWPSLPTPVYAMKDRNGMDLTEAEDIKKRWQEYTEGLYKKDLHDPDNHDGVITHLEPDILEYKVK